MEECVAVLFFILCRDQARGPLGRNSQPTGLNFALNGTQGEVGVSLKKNFFGGGERLIFILSPHKRKLKSTTTSSYFSFHLQE